MHEPLLVGVFQRIANLRHDRQRLGGRELPRFHELPEVRAFHVFHEDVVKPARLAEVVDIDDVRVVELRQRARLAGKARDEIRRERIDWRQDFQRDESIELNLPRLVNDAHPAAPEQFEDLELRQLLRHLRGIADVDDVTGQPDTRSARRRTGRGHQQALWAEPVGGVSGKRLLALGAEAGGVHSRVGSPATESRREICYRRFS